MIPTLYELSRYKQVSGSLCGVACRRSKTSAAAYHLFFENPYHPSLRFKSIHPTRPIYSVRIGLDYRAVGIRDGDNIIWYWIGSHADYDKLIRQFSK